MTCRLFPRLRELEWALLLCSIESGLAERLVRLLDLSRWIRLLKENRADLGVCEVAV